MKRRLIGRLTSAFVAVTLVHGGVVPTPGVVAAPAAPVPGGSTVVIRTGAPGKTVIGNLTVDEATGPGFLTAYPCNEGLPSPLTSDLNFQRGVATSNRLVARADSNGDLCVFTQTATHIIYDQVSESDVPSYKPRRLLDTRSTGAGKVASLGTVMIDVGAPGATVIGNLTVDDASAPGFLTAYPCSSPRPLASDLNFGPGTPTSNRIVARADENGKLCIYTMSATHIIYDQVSESTLPSDVARRLLDTRDGRPLPDAPCRFGEVDRSRAVLLPKPQYANSEITLEMCWTGKPAKILDRVCGPGEVITSRVISYVASDGSGGKVLTELRFCWIDGTSRVAQGDVVEIAVGAGGSTAIGNLTAAGAAAPGFLTAFPCNEGLPDPLTSDLNFQTDEPRSNRLVARADSDGAVCIFTSAPVHIIYDQVSSTNLPAHKANRLLDTRRGG